MASRWWESLPVPGLWKRETPDVRAEILASNNAPAALERRPPVRFSLDRNGQIVELTQDNEEAIAELPLRDGRLFPADAPRPGAEYGATGTPIFGGFVTGEDYNPRLDGAKALIVYDEMRRSDSQVRAALSILKLPLRAANFDVDPPEGSADPQDAAIADFCASALFDDDAMAHPWNFALNHILLKLDYGVSPLEKVFTVGELGEIRYHRLAPRLPKTIFRWIIDPETGQLEAVVQFAPKGGAFQYLTIPAKYLAVFCHEREGDNYFGRSVLRFMYQHWYWKSQAYRIDGVRLDRYGVGVPIAEIMDDHRPTDAELKEIKKILAGLRSHDRAFIVAPKGVKFSILTPGGGKSAGGASAIESINHHNFMIVNAIMAGFLSDPSASRGAKAHTQTLADIFQDSLQAIGDDTGGDIQQQLIRPLCFPPATRVTMADGTRKPIAEILPGDRVIAADGLAHVVMRTIAREYDGPLAEIRVAGHPTVLCTPNHKFLSAPKRPLFMQRRRYAETMAVASDDRYAYGKRGAAAAAVDPATRSWTEAASLDRGDYLLAPMASGAVDGPTEAMCRVIGYFLAEGCYRRRKGQREGLTFTLGVADERRGVLADLIAALQAIGLGCHVRHVQRTQSIIVTTHVCRPLVQEFLAICGEYSDRKHFPPDAICWSLAQRRAILSSYWNGDGCFHVRNDGYATGFAVSVSRQLAEALVVLLESVGVSCRLSYRSARGHSREAWLVTVNGTQCVALQRFIQTGDLPASGRVLHQKSFCDGGYHHYRVKAIGSVHYRGPVYNLTVQEDHSYLVEGLTAKNCDLNFDMTGRKYPRVRVSGIDSVEFSDLASALQKLGPQQSNPRGFMTPTKSTEDWIRNLAGAPPIDDAELEAANAVAAPAPLPSAAAPGTPGADLPSKPARTAPAESPAESSRLASSGPAAAKTMTVAGDQGGSVTGEPLEAPRPQPPMTEATSAPRPATPIATGQPRYGATTIQLDPAADQINAPKNAFTPRDGLGPQGQLPNETAYGFGGPRRPYGIRAYGGPRRPIQRVPMPKGPLGPVSPPPPPGGAMGAHPLSRDDRLGNNDGFALRRHDPHVRHLGKRTPVVIQGRTYGRTPTPFEERVFNLHEIPGQLDAARDALIGTLTTIRRGQVAALIADVVKRDADPKTGQFTDLRPDATPLPNAGDVYRAIRDAQRKVAQYGALQVRTELQKQGAPVTAHGGRVDFSRGQPRRVFLIRHGETADDRAPEKISSASDVSLDHLGIATAQNLADQFRSASPLRIITSPMARAVQTADIIAQGRVDVTVKTDADLAPWRLGSLTGSTAADAGPTIHRLLAQPTEPAPGGGESRQSFLQRWPEALRNALAAAPADATTIILAHSWNLKAAAEDLNAQLPERAMGQGQLDPQDIEPGEGFGLLLDATGAVVKAWPIASSDAPIALAKSAGAGPTITPDAAGLMRKADGPFLCGRCAHWQPPTAAYRCDAVKAQLDAADCCNLFTPGAILLAKPTHAGGNKRLQTSALVSSAQVSAQKLNDQLKGAVLDAAIRIRRIGLQDEDLARELADEVEPAIETGVARASGQEINEAFAIGREAEAQALSDLVDTVTYSAILDAATCDNCEALDGEEFDVDSPDYFDNLPPNKNCDGRDSCRCVYLYTYSDTGGA